MYLVGVCLYLILVCYIPRSIPGLVGGGGPWICYCPDGGAVVVELPDICSDCPALSFNPRIPLGVPCSALVPLTEQQHHVVVCYGTLWMDEIYTLRRTGSSHFVIATVVPRMVWFDIALLRYYGWTFTVGSVGVGLVYCLNSPLLICFLSIPGRPVAVTPRGTVRDTVRTCVPHAVFIADVTAFVPPGHYPHPLPLVTLCIGSWFELH